MKRTLGKLVHPVPAFPAADALEPAIRPNAHAEQPNPLPRWKTAVLTALGLYPLVLWLFPVLTALTAGLAPWLGKLLTVLVAVPLMSWGVMPVLTYLFRGWLYPAAPEREG